MNPAHAVRPAPARLALSLLLGALLIGTLPSGLPAAQAADAVGTSPTRRKIRDAGVLSLGYRAASAPFSYLDARRQPVGFSMDLCQRIVASVRQRLGLPDLEVRLVPVSSATRIPLVANGTVDLECGVTTHTAERARSVAFSLTTFVAHSRLMSRKDHPVQTLQDLRDQTVATTLATTSMLHLHAANQADGLGLRIVGTLDDEESMRLVVTGRAAAYAMDDVLLRQLRLRLSNPADFLISDTALTTEPYAIGLRRGDPQFKQWVDDTLRALYRSGEIRGIYRRWFEQPIGPEQRSLDLAPSAALQRQWAQPTDSPDPARYRPLP